MSNIVYLKPSNYWQLKSGKDYVVIWDIYVAVCNTMYWYWNAIVSYAIMAEHYTSRLWLLHLETR